MSNMIKSFIINLVVFALIALTMYLLEVKYNSFITLFKVWAGITALILGYFVIVQVNNGKKLKEERQTKGTKEKE